MVNFLQGTAEFLKVGRKVFNDVIVSLNLEKNYILCLIKEKEDKRLGKLLKDELEGVFLEGVNLFNGFFAEKIGDLMIIYSLPSASLHIGESFLNTYFGLLKTSEGIPYGFIPLKLIPKNGVIELEQIPNGEYSEILFEGFLLKIDPPIAWGKFLERFSIFPRSVPEKGLISFIAKKNINDELLEAYTEGLELALTFAQGKEVFRKITFSNGKAKIYFRQREDAPIYPAIPSKNLQEFLIKFLEYWLKLEKKERIWFKRLILNLVYAKTKNTLIENKLLNLMASFEMLKKGDTLTKVDLKEYLNITLCEGRFIITIRNKIMHGYLFEEAVNVAFQEAEKENDCFNAEVLKKIKLFKGFEKILKTYFALIFYLENFILRKISYKGLYYNPLNNFTEEIVNEGGHSNR